MDRKNCEGFVAELESELEHGQYFMGDQASLADYALLPFERQFARVDRKWYLHSPTPGHLLLLCNSPGSQELIL